MFEALGGKVPSFAHLPLLTGKEGKLSKRLGSLGVRDLREEGIEAMTISSFLAKLGTSEAIEPYYDLQSLAASLDFNKIGRAQPKFDEEELKLFNTKYVHGLEYDMVKDRIDTDEDFWLAVRGNIQKVEDIKEWEKICCQTLKPIIEDRELTDLAANILPLGPWNEDTFKTWVDEIKNQSGKKGKELFHPLRLAITAAETGPELKHILPLIGFDKVKSRLQGVEA